MVLPGASGYIPPTTSTQYNNPPREIEIARLTSACHNPIFYCPM